MRKFAAVLCVMVGLAASVPSKASAAPIGTNACVLDASGIYECDLYADFDVNGSSDLGLAEGNPGGYLLGYMFLLNGGADLSTFDASDVAHILVIHDQLFQLFSNTAVSLVFNSIFGNASTGANIDGQPITNGQIAGCPGIPSGVPQFGGVGYCTNADTVGPISVAWAAVGGGGNDLLRIHTALPTDTEPPTAPVPEPGSLTLLGMGGSAAIAAIRRRRAGKTV